MSAQKEKFDLFKDLHEADDPFVIPNPWDAGSALLLTSLGFKALATTSAGYAFSLGKKDGFDSLTRDGALKNAASIAQATHLPVTADLQNGFGHEPEICAATITQASELGLVGGSIEDATGAKENPIYDFSLAVERIKAAAELAHDHDFLLTARAENFLYGRADLGDTIKRLQAFSEAGADVLYAPGLPDITAIKEVCRSVDRPVNVVMGLKGPLYSVDELAEAGVKRISVGGSLARAAFGGLLHAAKEIKEKGTFTYTEDAMPGKDIAKLMPED